MQRVCTLASAATTSSSRSHHKIEKYEKRNTNMVEINSTLKESLKGCEEGLFKEKRMQEELRGCILCTYNLALFASRAAEVSTLKDLGRFLFDNNVSIFILLILY